MFFLFEYTFRNTSFQCFLILFTNAFVCDAKLGSITCTYNIVNVLLKSLSSFIPCYSLSNRAFLNVWLISSTQICQCWWSVFWPCSSSAPANARTVPSIPFSCWTFSFAIPFEHMLCQYLRNTLEFKRTCTWIVESCIFPKDKVSKAIFFRAF